MNDNQKNKVIIFIPPYLLGFLGVIFGLCIATFTERAGIAALVIIFSIIAALILVCVLKEILK